MDTNEFKKKLSSLPVVEPDEDEMRVLLAMDASDDGVELEAYKAALCPLLTHLSDEATTPVTGAKPLG